MNIFINIGFDTAIKADTVDAVIIFNEADTDTFFGNYVANVADVRTLVHLMHAGWFASDLTPMQVRNRLVKCGCDYI